jgi:hypothetical protein
MELAPPFTIQDDGGESIIRSAPNSGGRSVGMRALAVLLFAISIGIGLAVLVSISYLLLAFQAVTTGLVDITITFFAVIGLSLLIPFGWIAKTIFKKGLDLWNS